MFEVKKYTNDREANYQLVINQLDALTENETDLIANLSNASALLNQFLETINWVGFYLYKENELVLGPFQGLPACIRIPLGKGVCGKSALEQKTYLVADVQQFPGHIACDSASQSEIVIPIVKDNQLIGVLDIDSPIKERFDEVDQQYLEKFVEKLTKVL